MPKVGKRHLAGGEGDLRGRGGTESVFGLIFSLSRDPPTCLQSPARKKIELTL